jgi:hypothetical protein
MPDNAKKPSLVKTLTDSIRRILRRESPPGDPHAYVTAPLRHGPKGRSGAAVAEIPIAEIEDDSFRMFPPRRQV